MPRDATRTLELLLSATQDAKEDALLSMAVVLHATVVSLLTGPPYSRPGQPPGLRTGSLRRSYHFAMERQPDGSQRATVFSDALTKRPDGRRVVYAGFLERGTRYMEARPHLSTAADLARVKMTKAAGKAIGARQELVFRRVRL